MRTTRFVALASALALAACAVPPPEGPSIAAMPAQGKSLQAFQQDDMTCRQYASSMNGGQTPASAAQQSQFNSAALGTLLGAGLGAAIGAAAGNPGIGAAIGAGSGAIVGTAQGAQAAAVAGAGTQRSYDVSYAQCMASRGDVVPNMAQASYGYAYPPPGYAYAYPYPYPYPYPYYYGPAYVGVGFGWHRWR